MELRIGLFAAACIVAACSSRATVNITSSPSPDSIGGGRLYVTRTDGTTTVLEKAYVRSDTIFGKVKREVGFGVQLVDVAVPLTAVRSVEQQKLNTSKSLLFIGGAVLFVILLVSSFSGAAVVY